jgi:hypothetical protein
MTMSNDSIFDTHDTLIAAAASYFGVPADQMIDGEMHSNNGTLCVTLRVALISDDVVGIVKRMKTMREPAVQKAPSYAEMVDREDWYREWESLGEQAQAHFGSWANYKTWRQEQEQKVRKVEVPEHVWLRDDEVTDYQRMMALSVDEEGRHAVSVDDLTPDQLDKRSALVGAAESLREGYVARTVAATERLSGADGKPTSNADDFGGLPG